MYSSRRRSRKRRAWTECRKSMNIALDLIPRGKTPCASAVRDKSDPDRENEEFLICFDWKEK